MPEKLAFLKLSQQAS